MNSKTKAIERKSQNIKLDHIFSSDVVAGCSSGGCSVVPFSTGTPLFTFFATLHVVQYFRHKEPRIQVHSPFPTNEDLKNNKLFSNLLEYSGTYDSLKFYENSDDISKPKLQEILRKMNSNDPYTYFCIVPISLSNPEDPNESHSNTLIIWRESDSLKAYIVEPHGFREDPYSYRDQYFTNIQIFLESLITGSTITLLNNNEAFKSGFVPDTGCQGDLQYDVDFAINNTETDGLMITKGMCTTLSARLTMNIISKIANSSIPIIYYRIFGCNGIDYVSDILSLNKDILLDSVAILIQLLEQVTKFYYTRSQRQSISQVTNLSNQLTAIISLGNEQNLTTISQQIKDKITKRYQFHQGFALPYFQAIFKEVELRQQHQKITLETDGFHFPTTGAQESSTTTSLQLKKSRIAQKPPYTAEKRTPPVAGKKQVKKVHRGGYRKTRKRKQKMNKRTRKQTQKRYRKRTKNFKSSKKNKRRTK